MTIECPSCHTRFHLDDILFRGSKGMRVRCRKCGGTIVVMNLKGSPSPPRADAPSIASPPRIKDSTLKYKTEVARFSSPGPQTKAAPRPKKQKTVTLASPDPIRIDTAVSGPENKRNRISPEETATPRQEISEQEGKLIDDLNVTSRDSSPAKLGRATLQPTVDSTRSKKIGSQQQVYRLIPPMPLRKRSPFVIAALLLLLLGGNAAYLGFTSSGKKLLHRLAVGAESLLTGDAIAVPRYIIRDVSAYYLPETASKKLFVLEGRVENRGRTVGRNIRIRVTLLNGSSQVVATKTFPVGHVFTVEELRHMNRIRTEESMSNRSGEDTNNNEIHPGKSLPFMALFFDLQESMASYQMRVQETQ